MRTRMKYACSCQKAQLPNAYTCGHCVVPLEVKFRCPFLEREGACGYQNLSVPSGSESGI